MLIFTGDINLTDWYFNAGFGIGSRIATGFDPFCHLQRSSEDFWVGNFEGVASSVTNKKGFAAEAFRVAPEVLSQLRHLDAYGLANNHAMQHGTEAYRQTANAIIGYDSKCFGPDNQRSIIVYHQGHKVSLTAMSLRIDDFSTEPAYWHNPEYTDIASELTSLPSDAFKVLYIHWDNGFINRPSAQQKKFAHWLIDAGFDLVIGMHPHVLQGYEQYNGKYIFYSLGNFVFEMAWEPTKIGAIVRFDLATHSPTVEYVRIGDDCAPRIIPESEVPPQWRFDKLNQELTIDDNSEQYHIAINHNYAIYRKHNHRYILRNIVTHPVLGVFLIKDFVKRRFLH